MKALKKSAFVLLVAVIVFFAVFPFYWSVVTSLKTGSDLFKVEWIPAHLTLENYSFVIGMKGGPWGLLEGMLSGSNSFLRSVLNSVIVAGATSIIALLLALLSSYSLARVRFRGRSLILLTILSVSMFPQIAVLSGMYELMRWLGLYNTLSGLIFAYMVLVLPFTVWVMRGFMKSIPKELEEAAILDGCGAIRIVAQVFFPLIRPALATTGLLAFIAAWNEFLFALTLTLSSDRRTVPVEISMLSGGSQFELPWGNIMAASVLVTLPLVVLVLVFQKHIVSGLTSGAVKG